MRRPRTRVAGRLVMGDAERRSHRAVAANHRRVGVDIAHGNAIAGQLACSVPNDFLTQRLPLRIQIKDRSLPLRPGMLVEVDVDTRNQ